MTEPLDIAPVSDDIRRALDEDLGAGDLSSAAVVPETARVRARLVARAPGVLAGLPVFAEVLRLTDPDIRFEARLEDGRDLSPGDLVAEIDGPARAVLAAERTALNFLQRLSGIATLTRRYVDEIRGTGADIYDTRKTTPGWRALEKYAVRVGGGRNHRFGLFDQILIKDNHLALRPDLPLDEIVRRARESAPPGVLIEIEVDTLQQLLDVLPGRPDIILVDNMSPATIAQCVNTVRQSGVGDPCPQLEASGGITIENVRAYALAGVDRISVGALTHSAPALDLGLDF
jgi:nicotinate-nucleotide pyrophosphorylase (carboxylating)